MKSVFMHFLCAFSRTYNHVSKALSTQTSPTISYRIVNIEKDEQDDYIATVQVINKSSIFKIRPEEILSDDQMTQQFSQLDVRTLTYLGYLDMNSPKYRILAKRLSESHDNLMFALRRKGSSKVEMKTAAQISTNKDILTHLDQKDAHMVGFTTATEQAVEERKQMAQLKTQTASLEPCQA